MRRPLLITLFISAALYLSSCDLGMCNKTFQCGGSLNFTTVGFDSTDLDSMLFISTNPGVSDTQTISSLYGYPAIGFYGGDSSNLGFVANSGSGAAYTIIFPTAGLVYSVTLTATTSTSTTDYKCEEGSNSAISFCNNTLISYTVNGQTYETSRSSYFSYTYYIVK